MKNKVYEVSPNYYYSGYALVGAENAKEAKQYILDFKERDKDNKFDSWGYDECIDECDLLENVYTEEKGILIYKIYYTGQ